jgi:hypothetical protein
MSRMLATNMVARNILLPLLHDSILRPTSFIVGTRNGTPMDALVVLQTLLTNTDPAPTLISSLLSPLVPSLYAILSALDCMKVSNPTTKEGVRGMLLTWGRVVGVDEAVAVLWACVSDQGGAWTADIAGNIRRAEK